MFFILQTIVSWIGSQANIFEKQKVREIATLIRDTDRHGKAQITNVNEGEETQEMLQVTTCQNTYCWTLPFIDSLASQFSRVLVQSLVDKSDISCHSFHVVQYKETTNGAKVLGYIWYTNKKVPFLTSISIPKSQAIIFSETLKYWWLETVVFKISA